MKIFLISLFALFGVATQVVAGEFQGRVVVQWLDSDEEDRDMQLLEGFSFEDDSGKIWHVPSGVKINGASIPKLFWNVIGPPFVGDYRRASVIHDYYCDIKNEPWEDVHKLFYDASIAGGVSEKRAKIMYAAIYAKGPRWDSDGKELALRDSWIDQIKEKAMEEFLKSTEVSDLQLSKIKEYIDKLRGE